MARAFQAIVAAIILVMSFAALVMAGPYEDANAIYDRGDYATALRLLRPLASQGSSPAQLLLGHMYSGGRGVPQDYAEALNWYRKAADQGDRFALAALGDMYTKGHGVPQDYVAAHMWFNLAAAQGNQIASELRAAIAERMTPAQIAEAQKLAREWKPKQQ